MATLRRNIDDQLALLRPESSGFDFAAERARLSTRAKAREGNERLLFARSVASAVTNLFWAKICDASGSFLPIRLAPIPSIEIFDLAFRNYAEACATLQPTQAFYQIGELYTSLLPGEYRTRHGIFYTPPELVTRLLDALEREGLNWKTARVLDPACGGAAFAAYVAQRMLAANSDLPAEERLRDLNERLVGFDIDPFAVWLSAVLLDVVCLPVLLEANRRIDGVVRLGDMLTQDPTKVGSFDAVVGNPPYGKLQLSKEQRHRFRRSLYGHANIYGVFTDLAVALTKPGGLIGFVTPTSFLGGEYFKNLRHLLRTEAPPVHTSFVTDREGVFSDVLQETMLAVFRRRRTSKRNHRLPNNRIFVEGIHPQSKSRIEIEPFGSVTLSKETDGPWILPRIGQQTCFVRQLIRTTTRLADYGYRVATGQLVWNRHKLQFRQHAGAGCYPVLWAECIQSDGTFEFRAQNREHRPYISLDSDQEFLINQEPCVLVQRTTSKEQNRRLVAAMIPNSFIVQHPGYVVENHVNMLVPVHTKPVVSLTLLTKLLNSATVDHAFRCISGSVAVSAYELEHLPLPDPVKFMHRCRVSRTPMFSAEFDLIVKGLYHGA